MHRPVGAAVQAVVQARQCGLVEAVLILAARHQTRQVLPGRTNNSVKQKHGNTNRMEAGTGQDGKGRERTERKAVY